MNIAGREISRKLITWAVLAVVGLFVVVGLFSTFDKVQKEGVAWENQLNAQYQDNQAELSAYVSGFYEQTGIAKAKSDKLNAILLDAVKGRYDGKTSAQPGGGSLFSAIVEAYPDLSGLDIYDKIVDYVQSGRRAYKNAQSQLLDMLRGYNEWRQSGIIKSKVVSISGFPSQRLEARLGPGKVFKGEAALEQMKVIVLDSESRKAYETGELEPLKVDSSS